jgi:hypothetical protein
MAIWNNLWRFEIFYDHLVHFSGFGTMYQEQSGNTGQYSEKWDGRKKWIRFFLFV